MGGSIGGRVRGEIRGRGTAIRRLLVNLQSMTSKPNAGGGSKDRVTWKVEEAVHNFVHADKVTTNSSTENSSTPSQKRERF